MEVITLDDTGQKIIDATMNLVRDKGYTATTTKDIAKLAGVNECTLFRKFKSKKDIVLSGMEQQKWRADICPEIFGDVVWDLQSDLEMFMEQYMERITPEFVRLSIGLRAPQLYEEVAPYIMRIPQAFISSLTNYFIQMEEMGKLPHLEVDSLAMTIFSTTFGYTFLKASFDEKLSQIEKSQFIKKSVEMFIRGIPQL